MLFPMFSNKMRRVTIWWCFRFILKGFLLLILLSYRIFKMFSFSYVTKFSLIFIEFSLAHAQCSSLSVQWVFLIFHFLCRFCSLAVWYNLKNSLKLVSLLVALVIVYNIFSFSSRGVIYSSQTKKKKFVDIHIFASQSFLASNFVPLNLYVLTLLLQTNNETK